MVGTQGQAKWAKVAKKSFTYDITHKKTAPPKQKFFFECYLLDWPTVWAAEQLSSVMGGGATALVRQPKTAVFLRKSPKPGGSKSVKISIAFVAV